VARDVIEKITQKDYSKPITEALAEQAIYNLILARGTHFDSLMERLKEDSVRKIMQPLILGEETDRTTDDYLYVKDLGLIRDLNGRVEPANPIYSEVIIRTITWTMQEAIKNSMPSSNLPKYIVDNKIDINCLLKDFQGYWRENSEIWKDLYREGFYKYDEAAPHLVMNAFLQRVINSGGQIIREMALGAKRADLCVVYNGQKYPIELKILRNSKSLPDGLEQLSDYIDRAGAKEGWLVLFDRSSEKSWDEKIYTRSETHKGKCITIIGA
jgi:hypothetical protein